MDQPNDPLPQIIPTDSFSLVYQNQSGEIISKGLAELLQTEHRSQNPSETLTLLGVAAVQATFTVRLEDVNVIYQNGAVQPLPDIEYVGILIDEDGDDMEFAKAEVTLRSNNPIY